jgi:hypothetical protein
VQGLLASLPNLLAAADLRAVAAASTHRSRRRPADCLGALART